MRQILSIHTDMAALTTAANIKNVTHSHGRMYHLPNSLCMMFEHKKVGSLDSAEQSSK